MIAKRIAIGTLVLAGTVLILLLYLPEFRPRPQDGATVTGAAAIGGPFTLEDTKGNTVTEAALTGHYSLVYFGYTYCPDICPLALQNMTQALLMAGPVADDVSPIFITIDPERDTKEVMAEYLSHFHPRMLGLTGTAPQLEAAERAYRVYAAKAPTAATAPGQAPSYTMDHTGYIYLMDPRGQYIAHFDKEATAKDIAARLRRELNPR